MTEIVKDTPEWKPRHHTPLRRSIEKIGSILLLLLIIFVIALPILWLVQMSFRDSIAVFEMPPNLTGGWTLNNYREIAKSTFGRNLWNSVVVSALTTAAALAFGVPATYALSRHRFKQEGLLSFWVLAARLALPIGFALPLFNIFVRIRIAGESLNNTYVGITLAYLTFAIPLVIWTLRPFLDSIPTDMEEAATVDGASPWQVFLRIIVPISAPGLVSVGILTFISVWTEFFYALIFTRGDMMTAPVGVVNFLRYAGWDWGLITSAGVIVMVPVIIFALFTHRFLISGLTAGAIKG